MVALNWRLQRTYILIWCLALWAYLAIFPPAYENYYPTAEDREVFVEGMRRNAGMIAMWGPLEQPATIGQIVSWEAGSILLVLSAVMSVILIVNLHRQAEARGVVELQLSTGISRLAPAGAALATTALASVLLGVGSFIVLALSGLYVPEMPVEGAASFAAVVCLSTFASALLAQAVLLLVSDQANLMRVALLTIAFSFVLRAYADSEEIAWPNWLSALGWKTLVMPYVDDDWATIGLLVLICLIVVALLLVAERYREYQVGLVRFPQWKRTKPRRIRGALHLNIVLHRSTILVWALVIAGLTGFFLALTGSLSEWMEQEANVGQLFKTIFGDEDMKSEFIGYVLKIVGILIATMGVQSVVSYRSSEVDRTVDLARSTGIAPWVPLGAASGVSAGGVAVAVVAALGGGAVGLWSQETTEAADYDYLVSATFSQLAPALLLTAIAIALVGMVPRFTQFSWAPVVAAAMLTIFGPILNAPQWMIDLSPFEYVVTDSDGTWVPHVWMAAAAVVLIGIGLRAASRRDIS